MSELKAAVYLQVARMVEEQIPLHVDASPTFVATLVELVFNQLVALGEDLESFAHHAGRTTISSSDMYMAVRKNDELTRILKEIEDHH